MDIRLDKRILVVTGGTQGVGEAVARLAADSGAEGIVVTGRDPERGGRVARELTERGCAALFVAADLADTGAPGTIVGAALDRFGRVDCLVNAAALTDRAGLLDADLADWDRLFAVNARAPFFLTQLAVRDMKARGQPGTIVNILSVNAHCGSPELTVYSATKGALATLTKNHANAFLSDRIRVNGINLGWTLTPGEHVMQAKTLGNGEDWAERVARKMPTGRLLTAEDAAQLTLFLLSDSSSMMTGVLLDLEQAVVGAPQNSAGKVPG